MIAVQLLLICCQTVLPACKASCVCALHRMVDTAAAAAAVGAPRRKVVRYFYGTQSRWCNSSPFGRLNIPLSYKALCLTLAGYLRVHTRAFVGGGGGAGYLGGAGGNGRGTVGPPSTAIAGSSFLAASIAGTCTGLAGNPGNGYVTVTLL